MTGRALCLPQRPGDADLSVAFGAVASATGRRTIDSVIRDSVSARIRRRLSRVSLMVIGSAVGALEDAGISDPVFRSRMASVFGTSYGEIAGSCRIFEDGLGPCISPTLFHNSVHNAPLGYLSIVSGIRGPSLTLSESTLSGEVAVDVAIAMLREGSAGAVLAGSGDESCPSFFSPCWREGEDAPRSTAMTTESGGRLVTDEGCAFLVLESLESASARAARVMAIVDSVCQALSVAEALDMARRDGPVDAILVPAGLDRTMDDGMIREIRQAAGEDVRLESDGPTCGFVPASGVIRCALAVDLIEGGASRVVTIGRDLDGKAIAIGIAGARGLA